MATTDSTSPASLDVLDCIVCKKPLANISPDRHVQPSGGIAFPLIFASSGHYGSRTFDSFDGSKIEITICDGCVLEAAANNRVYVHRTAEPPQYWKPDGV